MKRLILIAALLTGCAKTDPASGLETAEQITGIDGRTYVRVSNPAKAPATEYEAYGETYAYPTNLPLGLSYATPSIDRVVRSKERAFSVYNGYVWTWPVLNSDETGVLEWSGVKRSWRDSDEVSWKDENDDDDREIIALAELLLAWKSKLHIDCDEAGAGTLKALYDTAFAELKVDRKQLEVPEDIQPIRL